MTKLTEHSLNIFVVDRNGIPIPGATVRAYVGNDLIAEATTKGSLDTPIRLQLSAEITVVTIKATVQKWERSATIDAEAGGYRFDFPEVAMPQAVSWEKIVAVAFGILFVGTMLVIAVKYPNPTAFQYTTFRIVLALACAGVASVIPGVLNLSVGAWLRAGGALAVFAIVYFYSPADLVAPRPEVNPTDPFTIYVVSTEGNGLVTSSYKFPFSDIKKNSDYGSFTNLVKRLPDKEIDATSGLIVFRMIDERIVTANGDVDVTSGGNTAAIVTVPAVINQFGDPHLAFTYLHSKLQQ